MLTPRIEINLKKIAHNAKVLKKLYGSKGINLIGVTKAVCGNPIIADTLVKSGISILADSRIPNIKRMRNAGVQGHVSSVLRTPASKPSAKRLSNMLDISLNTELSAIIKRLSKICCREYDVPGIRLS